MTFALTAEAVITGSRKLGLELNTQQADQLVTFGQLLLKWNRTYNLTALRSEQEVYSLHLLDSLTMATPIETLGLSKARLLDVGSGGGLPAIPMAVMFPQASFTLVDAVKKKTIFLRMVAAELGLKNVQVIHGRVEELQLEPFAAASCRAFASLRDFVLLTKNLVGPDGFWLAMKAREDEEEEKELPDDVSVARIFPLQVPDVDVQRRLVVLQRGPAAILPNPSL